MIYKDFQDKKLSALGFGSMRLPTIDGNETEIDEKATQEMVDYAMEQGINYYDTAWGYHGGQSELVIGRCLKNHPRNQFYLATKFPGYDLSNMDKVEEIFEKQLEKCQVDYFDFYLFHNVCERNINDYLDERHGIFDYLMKQKENGRIRHLGFSAHGAMPVLKRFLEKYGESMEFCQLQINYLDWSFQDAKAKVDLLKEYHIPVWVMEPLRRGKLATLTPDAESKLKSLRPEERVTGWAFRFLQTIPEVTMTLSGMSNLEQLKQNIATYATEEPLHKKEMVALAEIVDDMTKNIVVPCTACHYCTTHCPQELPIPEILNVYNEHKVTGGGFIPAMYIGTLPEEKRPSACIGCRSCEAVCPQQIKISEAMADFTKRLAE
ncbi:MAG: aldo/keto reductase [Clostridiales bacterium]|nr:aldo/keto reductase [Clostridiales bacterium]